MKNLFQFLLRNSPWLVGILLVVLSFYFVFKHNSYQRSVYLTSANVVSGTIYKIANEASSFIHLKKNNRELLQKNAELQQTLIALKNQIHAQKADSIKMTAFSDDSVSAEQYKLLPAEIVNMTLWSLNNFITINKGYSDGVTPDMGVISLHGVVGVVYKSTDHFSVIIPVINPKFRLGAKIKNSENFGSMMWNGSDVKTAQLTELAKHEIFHRGDTVVTSFSNIFPKGMTIGYVSEKGHSQDDNFNTFDVALATNFYTLKNVLIIQNKLYEEQQIIEKETKK